MNGFQTNAIVALLAVAFVAGGSAYIIAQKQERASLVQNSHAQVRQLVAAVGTLIDLPNEEPRVTVVTDTEKLHKQPYFADVTEGDRVLVFDATRKAVIYNPTQHRVVKVMTLQATPTPSEY